MTNWDKRFLDLAEHISTWTKDRSRGVGAVIVDSDKRVISFGYNGFPSGINDDVDERHERPAKYDWTVHAEENAVINAARIGASTKDATMYVTLFPCTNCAGVIINSGVKRIVCSTMPDYEDSKYGEQFKVSKEMFLESDVDVEFLTDEDR
jgi:dCMP deaminase